ncbi:MAG: glutamine synthetase III [Desulfovibrio sp.]|nr:glutamine synthetase III [Desulfovibrio sp.]
MHSHRTKAMVHAINTSPVAPDRQEEKGRAAEEIFGRHVFGLPAMRKRLPREVYRKLVRIIREGDRLDPSIADVVASAMKDWAMELGATHYTHWFHPMTGLTAEKHDAFLTPTGDGQVISEFSGKMLISGEPDASSFPSGGIRSTFEARGYTAWDPSVPAFIIPQPYGATLHIPTYFYSYSGEALDRKIPLLRSVTALSRQALRILRLFGNTTAAFVRPNVGPEQEYFLVDSRLAALRPDLLLTGRTLLGAPSPKGQEMEDHYFGAIPGRVMSFMQDVEIEMLKLGIPVKTRHNEVAPGQFELAPVFEEANIACDHNMLCMNMMRHLAPRHGFICLLHEKPFAGVNGSGKHNNWSMSTDTGENLLSPGETPYDNARFLLFLAAVIKAVDEYSDLLRLAVATAGNDHRLGANEAPPAVVSMFLGDELNAVLEAIETDSPYAGAEKKTLKLGVDSLPRFTRDTTDRNRTSPFAFTGNKFEFRMVGSADSIACANIMINASVAEALRQFADDLEKAPDFDERLHSLIRETYIAHKRIIFNGNGYDDAWIKEATEQRGLLNLRTTADALPRLLEPKNVEMLTRHGIFSETELRSRYEIQLENYVRIVRIEALTMADMARKEILPAVSAFTADLAESAARKHAAGLDLACGYETKVIRKLSCLTDGADTAAEEVEKAVTALDALGDVTREANFVRDTVLPKMAALRAVCDEAETHTAAKYWPFPTYGDLLFGV